MAQYAFEAVGEFDGATTALADGSLVNIGERLDNNGGRIETNDEQLANALRGHPAVKEVDPKSKSKSSTTAAKASGDKE